MNSPIETITAPQTIEGLPLSLGKHTALHHQVLQKVCMASHILNFITCDKALLSQQKTEMHDTQQGAYQICEISPTVLRTSQLDVHAALPVLHKKRRLDCVHNPQQLNQTKCLWVQMMNIDGFHSCKVKSRTGFHDAI